MSWDENTRRKYDRCVREFIHYLKNEHGLRGPVAVTNSLVTSFFNKLLQYEPGGSLTAYRFGIAEIAKTQKRMGMVFHGAPYESGGVVANPGRHSPEQPTREHLDCLACKRRDIQDRAIVGEIRSQLRKLDTAVNALTAQSAAQFEENKKEIAEFFKEYERYIDELFDEREMAFHDHCDIREMAIGELCDKRERAIEGLLKKHERDMKEMIQGFLLEARGEGNISRQEQQTRQEAPRDEPDRLYQYEGQQAQEERQRLYNRNGISEQQQHPPGRQDSTSVDPPRRQDSTSVDPPRRPDSTSVDPPRRPDSTSVDPPRRPDSTSVDPPRRQECSPSFEMDRNINWTVSDAYKEWHEGINGKSSVMLHDLRYGAKWRNNPRERKWYNRRRVLIGEIDWVLDDQPQIGVDFVLQYTQKLIARFGTRAGLNKLSDTILNYKKNCGRHFLEIIGAVWRAQPAERDAVLERKFDELMHSASTTS